MFDPAGEYENDSETDLAADGTAPPIESAGLSETESASAGSATYPDTESDDDMLEGKGNETNSVKRRRTAMGTTSSSPMDFAVRLIYPVVFAVACPSAKNVHKTNTYANIEVPLSS